MLLEERKQRNLTINDFCQEKNITPSQFYYYQQCINNPEKAKTVKKNSSPKIKPIQIINPTAKENTVIRFILPNSLQCILPSDMSPHDIKAILELAMSC